MPGIDRWIMGILFAIIALVGLFMASRAQDGFFFWTGLGFFAFGVLSTFGLIGRKS